MEIAYEGKEYSLDLEEMDTDQARAMERHGVPNLKALLVGVTEGDVNALQVCYWLTLVQNGQPGQRLDRLPASFKPLKFLTSMGKAMKAEQDEEERKAAEEADPKEDELLAEARRIQAEYDAR